MPDVPRPDEPHTDQPRPATPEGLAAEAPASEGPAPEAPASEAPASEAPAADVPSEAELARIATPATVRRAPRYRAFLVTGTLVGMVVGLVVAFATSAGSGVGESDGGVLPFLGGQNGVRWILALSFGVVGTFVGGTLAVLADRRSTRRRRAVDKG